MRKDFKAAYWFGPVCACVPAGVRYALQDLEILYDISISNKGTRILFFSCEHFNLRAGMRTDIRIRANISAHVH